MHLCLLMLCLIIFFWLCNTRIRSRVYLGMSVMLSLFCLVRRCIQNSVKRLIKFISMTTGFLIDTCEIVSIIKHWMSFPVKICLENLSHTSQGNLLLPSGSAGSCCDVSMLEKIINYTELQHPKSSTSRSCLSIKVGNLKIQILHASKDTLHFIKLRSSKLRDWVKKWNGVGLNSNALDGVWRCYVMLDGLFVLWFCHLMPNMVLNGFNWHSQECSTTLVWVWHQMA